MAELQQTLRKTRDQVVAGQHRLDTIRFSRASPLDPSWVTRLKYIMPITSCTISGSSGGVVSGGNVTLDDILDDAFLTEVFKDHCVEPLLFLLFVEFYKKQANTVTRRALASSIIDLFIVDQSSHQINIEHRMKQSLIDIVQHENDSSIYVFRAAESEIRNLLQQHIRKETVPVPLNPCVL